MAAQTYPVPTPRVGAYSEANWRPLIEQRLDPGYFLETFRYGLGSYYFDWLDMSERTLNLTTDNPKIYEKLEWENTIKTGSEIAIGAAGADISFDISSDDVTNGTIPLKVSDGIVIPAQNQATGEDRVYVVTSIGASPTFTTTASPLSADGNTITESEVSVAVASGTVLKIHSNFFARGTELPDGKYNYRLIREYETQIIKTTRQFEGGMQALKWYEVPSETGSTTAWFEGQDELELDHRKACDDALFLGEINDNSTLVQTSNVGGSNARKSTKGLWNWGKEVGQPLDYAGAWDMSYFYDVKDLLLANNVVSRECMFCVGSDLLRSIEESNLNWIREYSGGSNLMRAADELGIETSRVKVNGVFFQIHELMSFGNPLRYGNKTYNFSKYGIIIPEGQERADYNGKEELHPNFMIGYLNNNTENRTRIIDVIDGTTGRSQSTNRFDTSESYALTEMASIVLRPEQLITVEPE